MENRKLALGDAAPAFELPATDGKTYSLDSFKDATALVVIFSCNHCPYVKAYEDRIVALQEEFGARGARFVAINANDAVSHPDDSFDEMKERASEKRFNFPYLRDESQETAKAFGASHTPELFVFDKERKLAYIGKIDDNWKEPEAVKTRYLKEALEELVEGKEVSVPETHAIGCTIKWK
ncbi:MAG: redoxin domain-containing protein [Ignavibacteriales bacterium]|nr:redoxin domain-containing protein [Ignavibacteriales bacterium]